MLGNGKGQGTPDPLAAINADAIARARAANWRVTAVIIGPPPTGYVDLFVHQPNPPPGMPTLKGLKEWAEAVDYWQKNYFELSNKFKPIQGVTELITEAGRVCGTSRKLRQLRIMGHGSLSHVTIGNQQVWLDKLLDPATGNKTALGLELETLKDYLDPAVSIVILDHCLCGQDEAFLKFLSDLWGGVPVRAYRDYQYWEHDEIQVGNGVFTQCVGTTCHYGVEQLRRGPPH